jgi:hypothetical protein
MTEPVFTSVIHLIQHPSDYHGKKVRLMGFCVVEFEGKAIYVSEEDHRTAVTKNAIWLEVALSAENRALSGKVDLVEGTFDADSKGHLGMYSGTVREVERFEVWSDPHPAP